jgi:hypothetical protein
VTPLKSAHRRRRTGLLLENDAELMAGRALDELREQNREP